MREFMIENDGDGGSDSLDNDKDALHMYIDHGI